MWLAVNYVTLERRLPSLARRRLPPCCLVLVQCTEYPLRAALQQRRMPASRFQTAAAAARHAHHRHHRCCQHREEQHRAPPPPLLPITSASLGLHD